MKIKALTGIAVLALAAGVFAPVSAAQAATSTISGVVEYKGEAVPGILVGWVEPSTGVFDYKFSGADGTYSLQAPPLGNEYVVYANLAIADFAQTVRSSDYLGTFYGLGNERTYAYQALSPYVSGEDETVAVELAKPATLIGSDPAFARKWVGLETVAGEEVVFANGDHAVRANSNGAFTITNLVPGSFVLTNPDPAKIASVRSTPIPVTEGQTTIVDPLARAGATITGHVTDSKGKPLAKVLVAVGSAFEPIVTKTDLKGKYTLRALPKSHYTVRFGGVVQSISKTPAEKTVKVAGLTGETVRVVDARLSIGAKVEGHVRNPDTSVVLILDSHKRLVTAENGQSKFSFAGLDSGKYILVVKDFYTKKYNTKKFTLKHGVTTTVKTIAATRIGVTLKGHVAGLDAADAQSIQLVGTSGDFNDFEDIGAFLGGFAQISRDGNYTVKGIIPGTYGISVIAGLRETKIYSSVSIKKSRSKNLVAGKKLPMVHGTVTFGGEPLQTAGFDVESADDVATVGVEDGAFGSYLRPGTYTAGAVSQFDWEEESPAPSFQPGNPFWLSFPEEKKTFTVASGKNLDLGTFGLVVNDH